MAPVGLLGLLPAGVEPYEKLTEAITKQVPGLSRGGGFNAYEYELFGFLISQFLGRAPDAIHAAQVDTVIAHISDWLSKRVEKHKLFIPCVLSPWRSPQFSVGPIQFTFTNDFIAQIKTTVRDEIDAFQVNHFTEELVKQHADWVATIEVDGCDGDRAFEIASLSTDLAIVALQLGAPYMGTNNMSRLATRRGPGSSVTLRQTNGRYSGGAANLQPGLSIGDGYMAKIVTDTQPLIIAVGNLVRSFATGSYRLPFLEEAWCDGAYWLQQGLVEPVDSIAVAKLETSLEILFRAESSSGSEKRLLMALDTFFGLKPNDLINPNSQITAKQFAKGLVRDRSRVMHGTWSTLARPLRDSRSALEHVATTVVRAYALELEGYLGEPAPDDDIVKFLNWIAVRRRSASQKV